MREYIISSLLLAGTGLSPGAEQVSASAAGTSSKGFAQTTLENGQLKATLYLPDAQKGYYRGTRFDWSGVISRVDWAGHSFFCDFKQEHDPGNHDDICGTAEEFGIEAAPSYAQARPGEPFLKIGIGVLEKPDDARYQFYRRYKILTPGQWQIKREPGRIEFKQSLTGPKGWGYEFMKVIQLGKNEPTLKITRRLTNTGTETIDTDHYGHNFLRIDNIPAGTNYTMEFPFEPRFGADSKTQGSLELKGRSMIFTRDLAPDQAVWVRLEGFQRQQDNQVKIVNHLTGGTLTISGDQPLSKLVYYSSGGVLSPEPFAKVTIPAGQAREWTTTYRFGVETITGVRDEDQAHSQDRPRTLKEGRQLKPDNQP